MSARQLKVWLPAIRAGSGADVFVLRLAEALQRAGHQPLLQWFEHRYELMPWRLRQVPVPSGVHLIHAGSWQGFAFRRDGLPLVVTEHQYVAHPEFAPYRSPLQMLYHRGFIEACMRRSYQQADALVTVSEHVAEAMRNTWHSRVEVIHNWVDCRKFAPGSRAPSGALAKPFRLLFVGNPSRWKGADILPELAGRLGNGFEILCLGGLRKHFEASHLPSNMKLLSRTEPERMPEVYRMADAVLVPTRYEAFGYAALEAMACGLPVLGFASTGTAEVAIHGETALLAPVDDVVQLKDYACQLATSPSLCESLGKAGRLRAITCFDEPKAVDAYLALYQRVISARNSDEH